MANRGDAGFVFGIGFGYTGKDNSPSTVGDDWETGNTRDAVKATISNYNLNKLGTEFQFGLVGLGVYAQVGEWLDAPKQGQILIDVCAPYYTASGVSLYTYNEMMQIMGFGAHTVSIPEQDVMDDDRVVSPTAGVHYPTEGWQPFGQLDMAGGPSA